MTILNILMMEKNFSIQDKKRAAQLLKLIFVEFPFHNIGPDPRDDTFFERFWGKYFLKSLEQSGFLDEMNPLSPKLFKFNRKNHLKFSTLFSQKILTYLEVFDQKQMNIEAKVSRNFLFPKAIFRFCIFFLNKIEAAGSWDSLPLKDKDFLLNLVGENALNHLKIISTGEFIKKINSILLFFFGKSFIEINPDGMEFVGVEIPNFDNLPAKNHLKIRDMHNSLDLIKKIELDLLFSRFQEGLAHCRDLSESFLKDFLLQIGAPNRINNNTLNNLVEFARDFSADKFTKPKFTKSISIKSHLEYYFQSFRLFIPMMTNQFSHGKATENSYIATKTDLKLVFGYILTFINNICYFFPKN